MHRKPQLQDAARKLQEIFNTREGDISLVQAMEIIGQLEGFEGYQQLREFVTRHSRQPARPVAKNSLAASIQPAVSKNGFRQTLAMALCGHGGYDENYKRIETGRVNVQYVFLNQNVEISFVRDGEVLRALAALDAGMPSRKVLDPTEVVARVRGESSDGKLDWLMGFEITVADLREAKHQMTGWWTVKGKPMLFLNTAYLREPVLAVNQMPAPETMSRETYLALDEELGRREMDHAMGQDTEYTYVRMDEIHALLDRSPWTRDMDSGKVVLKSESIY